MEERLVDIGQMWLNIFARLKAGTSRRRTEALLQTAYAPVLEAEVQCTKHPSAKFRERYLRQRVSLRPAAQGINQLAATWGKPLRVLMGMVGLVLMITCANVAGLLMAKGAARRREIAVRMALGADARRVLWLVMREVLVLASVGVTLGVPLALALGRVVKSQLFGVAGGNVALFIAGSALALLAAAAIAGLLPAQRAMKVDPMAALRYE